MEPQRSKVIDGALYARATSPYAYDLRVHELGGGHVEALTLPRYAWHEVAALEALAVADYADAVANPPPLTDGELLERLTANRERSRQRARTKVRRLCKFLRLDTLLTLTYRENMQDRQRMLRDLDAFVKRVRRVIPSFAYVVVLERQKRGAWHAHLAVQRFMPFYERKGVMVKSFDLLRSMWRGVIGSYEGQPGGNVDVSRNRRVQRSSARLASYLSKYIGKTIGEGLDKWANSYSSSARSLPDAIVERVGAGTMSDALGALFDLLGPDIARGRIEWTTLLDGGGFYLCIGPPESG